MQDITNGRCGWCGTDELYVSMRRMLRNFIYKFKKRS